MMESLLKRIERNRKEHTRLIALILCLSIIVSLGVFNGFRKNAVAKTYTKTVLDCPYAADGAEPVAHTHSTDCFDENRNLICTLPELEAHEHSDACWSESTTLVCDLEENPGHVHTEECYTAETALVCNLEESEGHQHSEDCYILERGDLICENTDENHEHTDECYTWNEVLSCGMKAGEGAHVHSDDCYQTEQVLTCGMEAGEGAHTHTDDCYLTEKILTCGKEELPIHVHDENCFREEEITVEDEPEAPVVPEMPVSDPNADLETAEDWERDFDDLELSGNWAADLITVAATQEGNGESGLNFIATLNDAGDAWVTDGYTRYGAWYGTPYAEWSALFVSFCLRYADIPTENVPNNPTAALMAESFSKGNLFAGADYTPAAGDLIFFDTDEEEGIDHMGIVINIDEENNSITTVEGDRTDEVATFDYAMDDEEIVGYGVLPQNPDYVPTEENNENTDETDSLIVMKEDAAEVTELTADGLTVKALDGTELPEDATPSIAVVEDKEEVWNKLQDLLLQQAKRPSLKKAPKMLMNAAPAASSTGSISDYAVFDIGLGTEETLDGMVQVTVDGLNIDTLANVPENATVTGVNYTLYHIHDDAVSTPAVEVEEENGIVTAFRFETDNFSPFVLSYTVDFEYTDPVTGETFTWSWPGEGSYRLNDVLQHITGKEGAVSSAALKLIAGEKVDNDLYLTQDGIGDWYINSDVAFTSTYLLTMTVDGLEYEIKVTDAGSVDLTSISTINVTCDESEQATEVSRDAAINFTMEYAINGADNISAAKAADEWVYDLSSMIGTDSDSPFASLAEGDQGAIHDDFGNVVGTYQVTNGKIVLKITENSFWEDPSTHAPKTSVEGFVSFNVQLNENHNYNKSEETIQFPGNANVPIKYETKTLQSSKGVGTAEGAYAQTTDSSEVQMVKNSDGTYSLYYEISATPNIDFKTLNITDTLGGGQTLDASSVQLSVNGANWQNVTVNSTGTGFNFDVAANQGGSVHGGTTYKIRYKTTLSGELVTNKTVQTNRASWNWDLGTNEDNTSVKPKFDKNVTVGKSAGTIAGTYNLGNWAEANVVENPDGSATIYYDVKITSNTDDLSSLTVFDEMIGSGSAEVLKGTTSLGTATANNGTVDLLTFLANSGIEPGAEYHLRYSTTIQPKQDGTFDNVYNKARIVYDSTPKEAEITLKPKIDKTITSGKTVRGNGGEQTSGDLTVQKNNEDFYRLHYKITVTPGTGSDTLVLTDTISSGQEYIPGSFYLGFNDEYNTWKSFEITPDVNGSNFNFNLAEFLSSKGYSVTAKTTYQITYDTKITDNQIGTNQTNTSEWTWDHGRSGPDETNVTPGVSDKIEKIAMHGEVNVGNDQQHLYVVPGDIVDFTVVVGLDEAGNPRNMAGRRIYDEISNYGTLVGDVTISPAVGETTTLGGSTLDGTADGSTKKVYDFTFPAEGEFIQQNGYTITYHIKISENSDLTGRKQLLNKAFVDQTHKETKTPIEYGTAATTRKSFSEWDENNKKIYWYIDVELPEGKTLHNLYVTDYHMQYGTDSNGSGWLANAANLSFDSSDITVSWMDDSITEPAPSFTLKEDADTPNDLTVNNTKAIFFTELSHSIRIRVATISPVEFDSLTSYYAYNKAFVHSDEGEIGKPDAPTEKYTATDYRFKKTGTYDQDNNVATWTVEINKGFLEVNPDFKPYFTDTIPENMELVDNKISVIGYEGSIYNAQIGVWQDGKLCGKDFEVDVVDNVIQPISIGIKDQYNNSMKLSGNYYLITYQTKIKDEYLQEIKDADVLTEQKFTNFAKLQDETGDTKKTDDDTVEYKYDNLIVKESGQLILNEYIPYTVVINPEAKVINGDKPVTASDVISTDVNLYIGNLAGTTYPYVVDDAGTNMLESGEASISYNDDTRELSVTVPDGKKATFVFAVNAIESGTRNYENTVVLNAEISDEDSTEEEYTIKKSDAGISGVDLYVSLKKIDRNNPLKGLPGAKFKLVHITTPGIPRNQDGKPTTVSTYVDADGETQYLAGGNGAFGEEEVVGIYTTEGAGGLNFTTIAPYEVYYWVEVEPAPGYIMTNTERHYFVAYPIVRNDTEATTENQHNVWAVDNTVSAANGVTIVSARSGYSWNVTNLKEESVTCHFEGAKTLQGRDMEKDEFTFSVEAHSANVIKVIDNEEQEVNLAPAEMPMPENSTVTNPAGSQDTEVSFSFDNIDFTLPGTYLYLIKEEAGEDNTISYDQNEYTAEVIVNRDPDSGELLNPTITYKKMDGSVVTKPVFENKLMPGSLLITKAIMPVSDASKATNKTFTFEVELKNIDNSDYTGKVMVQDSSRTTATEVEATNGIITVTVTGTGTAIISAIPVGTKYIVTEPERNPADGWVQAGSVAYGDSTQTISANDADTATVTNKYDAAATLTPKAKKNFTNGSFKDKSFTFVLTEVEDAVGTDAKQGTTPQEITASSTETVSFDALNYQYSDLGASGSKNFYYTIIEKIPEPAAENDNIDPSTGIKYDPAVHRLEVTISDNMDGTLQKVVKVDGDTLEGNDSEVLVEFTNEQLADLEITKTLLGALKDTTEEEYLNKEYKVTIKNSKNKYLQSDKKTFGDDAYEFTVTAKTKLSFTNLPIDTYTATESSTGVEITNYLYNSEESVKEGSILLKAEGTNTIELKNYYSEEYIPEPSDTDQFTTLKVDKSWVKADGTTTPADTDVIKFKVSVKSADAGIPVEYDVYNSTHITSGISYQKSEKSGIRYVLKDQNVSFTVTRSDDYDSPGTSYWLSCNKALTNQSNNTVLYNAKVPTSKGPSGRYNNPSLNPVILTTAVSEAIKFAMQPYQGTWVDQVGNNGQHQWRIAVTSDGNIFESVSAMAETLISENATTETLVYQLDKDGVSLVEAETSSSIRPQNATAADWVATLTNLPTYQKVTENGVTKYKVFQYAIEEIEVNGEKVVDGKTSSYTVSSEESTADNVTTTAITNTEIKKVDVNAIKAWVDSNGDPMLPPANATVTFELFADGIATGKIVVLDGKTIADDKAAIDEDTTKTDEEKSTAKAELDALTHGELTEAWKAEWKGLQKYKNGSTTQEVAYTVKETVTYPSFENQNPDGVNSGGIITNKQSTVDFDILKVAEGTTIPLEGASFTIQKIKETSKTTSVEVDGADPIHCEPQTTGIDGIVHFTNISAGYYEVKETNTPVGYVQTGEGTFYVKVDSTGIKLLEKHITDGKVSFTEATTATVGNVTIDTSGTTVKFKVENTPGTALPNTGGIGTTLFTVLGGLVTATAGAILTMKTWRRRKQHA